MLLGKDTRRLNVPNTCSGNNATILK